eukprot:73176_1
MTNVNYNNEFDENFFISYCILFGNISENIDKIIQISNNNPLEYYMFIQKLCLNDIIQSLSELKQELKFKKKKTQTKHPRKIIEEIQVQKNQMAQYITTI